MKDLSREDIEKLLMIAVADLAYAVGYTEGLGKPSSYLSESLTFFNKEILPGESEDEADEKSKTIAPTKKDPNDSSVSL